MKSVKYGFMIFVVVILLILAINISYEFIRAQKVQPLPLTNQSSASDSINIYANTKAGMFSPFVANAIPRVYVPNSLDGTVSEIDPTTYQVSSTFKTGKNPQHVVPSYDLQTLWVLNDLGNSLTPIDPNTTKPGKNVHVDDPYNLYFTPDGQYAIVVAESRKRLDFRDPHTMALRDSVPVHCKGINHMDFTADGRYAIASCEFSGELLKLDVADHKVLGYLTLDVKYSGMRPMPQDVRLSPDGKTFYVADMMMNGVFIIDPVAFRQIGFMVTGKGTHGIYPSRDGKFFYVANRGCNTLSCPRGGAGSVTVINPITQKIVTTWPVPRGGSPDMGNVSADGKELWLCGRYDGEVYVFDTTTGKITHRIRVGRGPHGLTVWPQPGQYSLGHTGNMR